MDAVAVTFVLSCEHKLLGAFDAQIEGLCVDSGMIDHSVEIVSGFQREGRNMRLLIPLKSARWLKHFLPSLAFLAIKRR